MIGDVVSPECGCLTPALRLMGGLGAFDVIGTI
jgi:hypothetical protein